MITLHDNEDYYILEDGQGATWGGGLIYTNLMEIKERCMEWADMDGYDDPSLSEWTIGDCLENWTLTLWKYDGARWNEVDSGKDLDFISTGKRKLRVI